MAARLAVEALLVFAALVGVSVTAFTPPPEWTLVSTTDATAMGRPIPVTFVLPIPDEDWAAVTKILGAGEVCEGGLPAAIFKSAAFVPGALDEYAKTVLCPSASVCACVSDVYAFTCEGPGLTPARLQQLWDVKFQTFARAGLASTRTRAVTAPTLPPQVAAAIEFVAGLGATPPIRTRHDSARMSSPGLDDDPSGPADPMILPSTLKATYGIPQDLALTPNVSIALVEFQNDLAYWDSDLDAMAVGLNASVCHPTSHYGPFDNSSADAESALDSSVVGSLTCGADIRWMTIENWIWEYAHTCVVTPDACANVSSISWGWWEEAQCDVDSAACSAWNVTSTCGYAARVDKELGLGALLGKTHVVASGDAGCHGRTDETCSDPSCRMVFPCSSQWVTCVSATAATVAPGTWSPLVPAPPACATAACAASVTDGPCVFGGQCQWTPGGGVSTCIPRPDYQAAAVTQYLTASDGVLPPVGDYGSGRAGPDVAAIGHNLWLVYLGQWIALDGTSASTPLWASLLTYANQDRLNKGLGLLGPANPWLYNVSGATAGHVFQKIADASNNCTESMCCATGFGSSTNTPWDAVTGLGPARNLAAMLNVV